MKSAYLDFVISVYIDTSVNDSGIDIDNLWRCFVRENGLFSLLMGFSHVKGCIDYNFKQNEANT